LKFIQEGSLSGTSGIPIEFSEFNGDVFVLPCHGSISMVCKELAATWDREKSGKWSVIGQEKFKRLSTAYFLQREGKSYLDPHQIS